MRLALLLFLALPATARPPVKELAEARLALKSQLRQEGEFEESAKAFSIRWGWHVAAVMLAARRGQEPERYLTSNQERAIYDDWVGGRNAQAVNSRDYGWFKLDDWERRKLFGQDLERERGRLEAVLLARAERPRLERFRDALLAGEPEPSSVTAAMRRASEFLAQGRSQEASDLLKAMGPEADFSPRAILARALARMADEEYILPWDEWERFYEALQARDKEGRYRELSWEMLCRAAQSRRSDWKFEQSYGQATDAEWDSLMSTLGLPRSAAELGELKEFLKTHLDAARATVKLARSRPACGAVLRVAADGSGDVRTIGEGVARLAAGGGRGTLLLEPGVYSESVVVSAHRVVIRARRRGSAVIEAPRGFPGLEAHGVNGLVVDGVTIRARGAHALEARRSHGITVKNSRLEVDAGYGAFSEGSEEVSLLDCEAAEPT